MRGLVILNLLTIIKYTKEPILEEAATGGFLYRLSGTEYIESLRLYRSLQQNYKASA